MSSKNPATGAQTALYYVEETEVNQTPENPVWKPLRFTGGIPALQREVLQSAELDGNREITEVRTGSKSAQGTINVELSHLSHNELFAACLQSSFEDQPEVSVTASTTIGFVAEGNKIVDSTADSFTGVLPGRKLTVSGASEAGNNTVFTVAQVLDAKTVVVNEVVTEEAEGEEITISADSVQSVRVGGTVRTFTLLVQFNDLKDVPCYDIITGVEFTGFSLNLAVNAIATGGFEVIGRDYFADQSLPNGSTFAEPTETRPYTGLDGAIIKDGEQLGVVTSMTPNLANGANAEYAIGSSGVSYVSYGRANNTFELATAFTSYSLFTAYINEEQSHITLRLVLDGNFLEFNYPRTQLTSGSPNPEGEGTITLSVGVQALRDEYAESSVVITCNKGS